MKKTLLLLLVIGAGAAANKLQAQGTVFLNNYDARAGIYAGYPSVPAPAGFTFVEVLAGPSPSSWVPLLNSSGQGPIFTIEAAGKNALGPGTGSYFNVGYATVPGVSPGASAFFGLFGWMGASSWDLASDRDSVVWTQTAGTASNPAQLMIPHPLDVFVPEPSPAALAGLALAIFGFRRWHRRSRNTAFQMNKTLLLLLVIGAGAAANKLQAQGTVFLNNYDARAGIYYASRPAPAGTTFVEILAGPTVAALAPLFNSSGQGPVFTIEAAGVDALGPGTGSYFNVGYASVPGVPPGAATFFALLGWASASSWDLAFATNTLVWTQTVGTANNPAQLMIPLPLELIIIPEPSPAALAGLALAIFGFRDWCKRSRWSADSAPDLTDPRPSQPRRGPQRGPG